MRTCKQCGKQLSDDVHGNAKFCSDKCFQLFYEHYRDDWRRTHPTVERNYVKSGVRAYNNIKARTTRPTHPNFSNYGGKGIRLELTLEEFLEIYFSTDICSNCGCKLNDEDRLAKDGRTLDRIDVARNYQKDNLRLLCRSCNASFSIKRHRESHTDLT